MDAGMLANPFLTTDLVVIAAASARSGGRSGNDQETSTIIRLERQHHHAKLYPGEVVGIDPEEGGKLT